MKYKDWIIYNNRTGNLWCLTIKNEGGTWYMIEWVNLPNLSTTMLKKMVDMGYHTMMKAALTQGGYAYVIGRYSFSPKEIDNGYWNALMPSGIKGKQSTHIEVDKAEFEKQVAKIFRQYDTDFEYGG